MDWKLELVVAPVADQDVAKAFYLDRLAAYDVANPPGFEQSWAEFGRCLVWGVYIGWLTTNIANYGWEISVLNHLRLTTAFEDHDAAGLMRARD